MELSIQERLKDVRVERGLTLEQLAEQQNPSLIDPQLRQLITAHIDEDSDPEQASLSFICKRLKLNLRKLSGEEKKWLKKIAGKSDLLKNPKQQRGKK